MGALRSRRAIPIFLLHSILINPATASLTLELVNDGNVVKTDDDGEREGGIVTFEVQAGDIQEVPSGDR